jgi:hypothetical protein
MFANRHLRFFPLAIHPSFPMLISLLLLRRLQLFVYCRLEIASWHEAIGFLEKLRYCGHLQKMCTAVDYMMHRQSNAHINQVA